MASNCPDSIPCDNFREFKEALLAWRKLDDVIIHKLNTTLPIRALHGVESDRKSQCESLYQELNNVYEARKGAINSCISVAESHISKLSDNNNSNDSNNSTDIKGELTKLRLMRSELRIEDIIKSRSMKAFEERCWSYFKPSK